MTRTPRKTNNLLSYQIIVLASSGDTQAINTVLGNYDGYIATLSTKQLYDESGVPPLCACDTLRRRLETKLITKILTFRAA